MQRLSGFMGAHIPTPKPTNQIFHLFHCDWRLITVSPKLIIPHEILLLEGNGATYKFYRYIMYWRNLQKVTLYITTLNTRGLSGLLGAHISTPMTNQTNLPPLWLWLESDHIYSKFIIPLIRWWLTVTR